MSTIEFIRWRPVPTKIVKLANQLQPQLVKLAAGDAKSWELTTGGLADGIRTAFNTMRLGRGKDVFGLPATPNPMLSMLVGGLAGAGIGYGGGALASYLLPPDWKKDRLRRTTTMLGALAGAAPGAAFSGVNLAAGLKPWSDEMFKVSSSQLLKIIGNELDVDERVVDTFNKVADFGTGFGPASIPVDDFNRVVWGDHRISDLMSPPEKAAITGFVSGASQIVGKQNRSLVTPMDLGMMAAGMGSGYLSGAIVGKGLSALMGAPPSVQDRLKETGVWAGALKGMIPLIF